MRTDEERLLEIETSNDGHGPDPIHTEAGYLAVLAVAALQVKTAEARLDAAVHEAREHGHTWQAIGDVLGLTRQGALKRFKNAA